MSETTPTAAEKNALSKPLPVWLGAGVVGLAAGAGVMLLAMHGFGYRVQPPAPPAPAVAMGGGGGGMMGMGGGGGGARGKRNLTSLVAKLELLTGGSLHVELDSDQATKIAAALKQLDQAEGLNDEAALAQLQSLEAMLTPEQKAVVDSIGLPFGGRPGGGMPSAAAPSGSATGGTSVAPPMMMGMGSGVPPDPNENPFHQEVNQKRLRDLLARLKSDLSAKP